MSHFTVTVFGDDVEGQLAPYHEFECTGNNDQYVVDFDITAECQEEYESSEERQKEYKTFAEFLQKYHGLRQVPFQGRLDLEGDHKFGYYEVDRRSKVVKAINRTNPNKKWDWYLVGGRWNGYYKVLPKYVGKTELGQASLIRLHDPDYKAPAADRADSLLKKHIDLRGMQLDRIAERGGKYDRFHSLTMDCPPIEPWALVREKFTDIEEARKYYHDQPGVIAAQSDRNFYWDIDEFLVPRDEYVGANDLYAPVRTFAFVANGEWHEKATMGWWAITTGDKEKDAWAAEFAAAFDAAKDDELVTVVDCHI